MTFIRSGALSFVIFLVVLIAVAIGIAIQEDSPGMAMPSASVSTVVEPHGYTPYGR